MIDIKMVSVLLWSSEISLVSYAGKKISLGSLGSLNYKRKQPESKGIM